MITNVKLLKKEIVAEGTMAFYFEKPEGFEFRAGQFTDFDLSASRKQTLKAILEGSRWGMHRSKPV